MSLHLTLAFDVALLAAPDGRILYPGRSCDSSRLAFTLALLPTVLGLAAAAPGTTPAGAGSSWPISSGTMVLT